MKGIDAERLGEWFEREVDGAKAPLRFSLITGGHSNLTFEVTDASGNRYVLRRPPLGAVLATAHDMAREHRILAALASTRVPVPRVMGLCGDESVNGAPFYVMAYVEGRVLTDHHAAARCFSEAQRYRLGGSVVEVLAELHRVNPDEVGLGGLGRKEAYLERQLKRWRTQWEKTKTRELPAMEEAYEILQAERPEQVGASIVHGDYRLGNMIVDDDAGIAAVLDWELCTLGDPLADLGYVMNNWAQPGEEGPTGRGASRAPTWAGGFPSREEFLTRYERLTGRNVSNIDYYRGFQYWRMAAIAEGVMARYLKGVMGDSVDTEAFRTQIAELAEAAVRLVRNLK